MAANSILVIQLRLFSAPNDANFACKFVRRRCFLWWWISRISVDSKVLRLGLRRAAYSLSG